MIIENELISISRYADQFIFDDQDGDGYLTFEEVYVTLNHASKEEANKMFKEADSNDNNLLKGAEFDVWLGLVSNASSSDDESTQSSSSNSSDSSSSSSNGGKSYYELAFGHDYLDSNEYCTGKISLVDGQLRTTSAELISCLYKSSSNSLLIQANYNSHRENNYIKLVEVNYQNSDSKLYYPPASTTTSFTIHLEDDTPTSCIVWYEGSGHVDMPY